MPTLAPFGNWSLSFRNEATDSNARWAEHIQPAVAPIASVVRFNVERRLKVEGPMLFLWGGGVFV